MLTKLRNLFRPAPFRTPITDDAEIQKQYKYWRLRIFYSIYAGYVVFYFTRKSFTFVMPHLLDLGYSMSDVGFLGTVLYISYGLSKFIGGMLADRANPRYLMSIGLILTGLTNIFFGFSSSIVLFALFWGLNGFFQGWGWPPCAKQLTFWFSKSERGKWWSLKATSHNVGGALAPLIVALFCTWFDWRWGMFAPGLIALVVGFWLMDRLRDIPQSLGLPSVERFRGEEESSQNAESCKEQQILSTREILFKHVLNNRAVWILALSYFFVYVVRTGLNDWATVYLNRERGYSLVNAASSIVWFEAGGFLGTLVSGWASDRFFQGRRVPVMVWCALGTLLAMFAFWCLPPGYMYCEMFLMAVLGFMIFGPQLLVGLAAAEFVDKKAACTANGFAGCFAYIGAAATGYPLSKIIDIWHWQGFFITLLVCSAAIFLVLLPLCTGKEESIFLDGVYPEGSRMGSK